MPRTPRGPADLDRAITAALVLCAEVIEETRPHPDVRPHHDQCHHRHPDCLAVRIRRTLIGEVPT